MKKVLALVLTIAMTLSLLAGCSGSTATTDSSSSSSTTTTEAATPESSADIVVTPDTTVTVDPNAEPDGIVAGTSLNFYSTMDCVTQLMPSQAPQASWMYQMMYDTLFYAVDGDYNNMEGLLVKEWTTSEDGLTWVLTLHDDVYFRNGTNLTAESVIGSFDILGEYGSAAVLGIQSYTATGTHEVTVTFALPNPEFMYQFAVVHTAIFDPTLVYELGITPEAFLEAGSGPYYMSASAIGDYMTFTANENYWHEDRMPHIETLNCKVILDSNTQVTALLSGECDYGAIATYDAYDTVVTDDSLQTVQFSGSTKTLWVNVDGFCEALANIRVREALTMMIDMDQLAAAATGGYGYANNNAFINACSYVHDRVYDPEGALAILAEEGIDPSDIVIQPITDSTTSAMFTNLQAQLSAYGITVDFAVQDSPAVNTAGWAGEWDIWTESALINEYSYSSPITMVLGETGKHKLCHDDSINPTIWQLCVEAFSALTREEELAKLDELLEVLDVNYAYLGSIRIPTWSVASEKVQNVVIDQYNGGWLPYYAWVAEG